MKKRRSDIYEKKELILEWISNNKAKSYICRDLKCKPETLDGFLKEWGIEYKGNQSHKGEKLEKCYKPASYYFDNKHPLSSHKLYKKLIRDGLKKEECEECGVKEWFGKKLPLELHHINGDHFDNSFENLQILCPNCHSVKDGNAGASNGKYGDMV